MFPPIPKYDYSLHTLSFPSFSHTFSTMPNSRKLLPTTNSSLPPTSSMMEDREYSNTSVSCCAYNNLKLNPPFDSAMALTVLVLLTALFFMGFFSIYIRRFADESSVDPTRRRRDPTQRPDPNESTATTSYLAPSRGFKGVEPEMIESLPVHEYYGGDVKQGIYMELELELECAICLSEFEEGDRLKEIPYCGHVFHVECIDMWLSSHVTCPLCRTVKLFPVAKEKEVVEGHVAGDEEEEERGSGVGEMQGNGESDGIEREVRLTVDERDTWSGEEREVEGLDMMRTTNCSRNCERVASHRSLSF